MPGGAWPDFTDEMPWVEDVEETPDKGAPIPLVDNTALIDQQLAMHNCMYDYPSPEACGKPGGTGTGGSAGSGTAGGSTSGTDTDGAGENDGGGSGCGCRLDHGRTPAAALLALGLLGLRRRRRPA